MNFPINIRLKGRKALILGGGETATRKALKALEFGADTVCISRSFRDRLKENEAVRKIALTLEGNEDFYRENLEEHFREAFIIMICTSDGELNKFLAQKANSLAKLVDVADNMEASNFYLPSYIKRGGLVISISTDGKSPSLARKIRTDLEEIYGEEYEDYVELLSMARESVKRNVTDYTKRSRILKRLAYMTVNELKELIELDNK